MRHSRRTAVDLSNGSSTLALRARSLTAILVAMSDEELRARLDQALDQYLPGARVEKLRRLPGGVSSDTFAAELAARRQEQRGVVVKVAPPGLAPVGNRDVLRQARLLRALRSVSGVRVPEVLAESSDSPPFFIMSFVPGDAYEPRTDLSPDPPTPDVVRARARAAAETLARLQQVEPATIGLGEEPVISPVEEIRRWARLFDTGPGDLQHGQSELCDRLLASAPAGVPPRVLHGDYRLGNMQFVEDRLDAVIDWEIWSIGDPRSDLAWFLVLADPLQRYHEQRDAANNRAGAAMPSPRVLLEHYRGVEPASLEDLAWFEAASRYKMAATTSALVKHNRRRATRDPRLDVAATAIPAMLRRASTRLDDVGA
jgi:aminoglycoside phosphotransferase (APT) family kinase protein